MIRLQDLEEINVFVKLNKEFTKLLLKDTSKIHPIRNKGLAVKLGVSFNDKLGFSSTIAGWYYKNKTLNLKKLKILINLSKKYNWKDVENNLISLKSSNTGRWETVKPRFPVKLDKNLGLIIGHILGDGWIDKKYLQIGYSNSNNELLGEFKGAMEEVFGVKPRIWVQKKNTFKDKTEWLKRVNQIDNIPTKNNASLFYPRVIGQILYLIFGEFARGGEKEMPKVSIRAPKDFKIGLLHAFYDDEGSVFGKSRAIRIHQDNSRMLEDIRKLLLTIDIESNEIHYCYKRNKKRYYFNISGYENLHSFKKIINFTSSKKKSKLNKMIEVLNESKTPRLRVGETKRKISELLKGRVLTTTEILSILKQNYTRLNWCDSVVRRHLHTLEEENILSKERVAKGYLWTLK